MNRSGTEEFKDDEETKTSDKKGWAKLTSINHRLDNLSLVDKEYTFGRGEKCSVSIQDKRLSSTHCKILKGADGNPVIMDMSTNGTFWENEKIGREKVKPLTSGDKVYLLHPSKVPENDVLGYIFAAGEEDISALKR
mmetsp:Transcript_23903/g.20870  ORF Transcript_23903/g.20870 Transcript_23903/m.20870 type:complete len:137 (+) Transcript_23903:83-493(+)